MNESIKKKINGLGRAGQIITTILIVLTFIYCGIWLIGPVVFPVRAIINLIEGDYAAISESASLFFDIDLLIPFLITGSLLLILFSLQRFCSALKVCETPFSNKVIRRLNGYAWLRLIGWTVIYACNIIGKLLNVDLPVSGLVMYVAGLSISILFSIIMLFLTRVFRHGAQLQKEIDETL